MYSSLELADDRPLARLAIDRASIGCMAAGAQTAVGGRLAAFSVTTNGTVRTNMVTVEATGAFLLSMKESVERLFCLLDGSNVVAVAQAGSADRAIALPPATRWISVKPGEYRRQTKLLMRANELARQPGGTATVEVQSLRTALKETQWLTQHLRQRGEAALRNLEKEGKAL
jgi:hypothetical protein